MTAERDHNELVARYFQRATSPDIDSYFAQFTADALLEDEGHEYRGVQAIRDWRTTVPQVVYSPRHAVAAGVGYDAVVGIAGDFPGSPVDLNFHFEFAADDRISLLTIQP